MPLLALIVLFVLTPLAELYVIFAVSDAIDWLPTLAILAADSILGAVLLRMQGRAVWQRFNAQMQSGHVPTREVLDGVLVIFGGAFLVTPGFLTDILGLLLLLPPTRSMFRGLVTRQIGRRAVAAATSRRPRRQWDVEGTASEREPGPEFELPPRTGGRGAGRRL